MNSKASLLDTAPSATVSGVVQSTSLAGDTISFASPDPNHSPLQAARLHYAPRVNPVLRDPHTVSLQTGKPTTAAFDADTIARLFPHLFGQPVVTFAAAAVPEPAAAPVTVGVVLSGGPAPGGHNVICGLHDYIAAHHPQSRLLGFVNGPDGILTGEYRTLDATAVAPFRNQGGFHLICSGRTKIETPDQFAAARATVTRLALDALVIVGGDDSNSNAMKLAENFRAHGLRCAVNGAPKTIDNDLRNAQVEVSFGFDTASKSYAEGVASLAFDAVSAQKAYHFVRVMGRSASHIALEVALQTHPNLCFIGEEVLARNTTLVDVVDQVVRLVVERAARGKNYGIVVLPEGLVEFMPDVEALIVELNELMAGLAGKPHPSHEQIGASLTGDNAELFNKLPRTFADQLTLERDPHGNVQVAKIEAERLLIGMVGDQLQRLKAEGAYCGKFSGVGHYLGYEARCAMPSNFDANYTYGLGRVAAALCCAGKTGYIAALSGLTRAPEQWTPAGFPLTMMMNMERRSGHEVAVIKKMLVDLEGKPFRAFEAQRDAWRLTDSYRSAGPAQFWGPSADAITESLRLESEDK